MKSVQRYVCEKCFRNFRTKEEALACEESHALPAEVFVTRAYKPIMDENRLHNVPNRIIVKMTDGRFFEYTDPKKAEDFEIPKEIATKTQPIVES